MDRWEAIQKELYRQAILRQIIREEIERREREKDEFDSIFPKRFNRKFYSPFEEDVLYAPIYKTPIYEKPEFKKFTTYINGKLYEGPRKKKNTKSKLKRKSCFCKKN